jgi:hypothetical protein
MRSLLVGLLAVAACTGETGVTAKNAADYERRLVTDDLPFGSDRGAVRAWFDAHDGCRRRTWEMSDEFIDCDRHPMINRRSRPSITFVRYDASGRADAFAAMVQVPCRMYGKCDRVLEVNELREPDFIDHHAGLRSDLAGIGQREPEHAYDLPSMQQRTIDALAVELSKRYGPPIWRHPHGYGEVWTTPAEQIGLFLFEGDDWVIETHEARAAAAPGAVL